MIWIFKCEVSFLGKGVCKGYVEEVDFVSALCLGYEIGWVGVDEKEGLREKLELYWETFC